MKKKAVLVTCNFQFHFICFPTLIIKNQLLAHPFALFVMSITMHRALKTSVSKLIHILYVAKHDLGKVRLKPMQSAVPPLTVHDLWGGPWQICRAVVSCCISHAILPADRCGSFARYFFLMCESLRILAPSHPSPVVAGL